MPPYHETFSAPANVSGYLEWCSGTLFVNKTPDFWDAFKRGLRPSESDLEIQSLLRTITHETYHFWQITTTGFAYQFAGLLFQEIRRLLVPLVASDEAGGQRLKRLLDNPPPPSRDLAILAHSLDEPGSEGITTRDIIESAAFLYEYKTHMAPEYSNSYAYSFFLKHYCPAQEYRRAYEFTNQTVRNAALAFDSYLTLSVAALYFDKPHEAFKDVLDVANDLKPSFDPEYRATSLKAITEQVAGKHRLLGSAADVAFKGTSRFRASHPVYTAAVRALDDVTGRTGKHSVDLVAGLERLDHTLAEAMIQPLLLKDGQFIASDAFERFVAGHPDVKLQMEGHLMLGVLALRILNVTTFRTFSALSS